MQTWARGWADEREHISVPVMVAGCREAVPSDNMETPQHGQLQVLLDVASKYPSIQLLQKA